MMANEPDPPVRNLFIGILTGIVGFFFILLGLMGSDWLKFSFPDGQFLHAGLAKSCYRGACDSNANLHKTSFESFPCLSRLNVSGMFAMILYVISMLFAGLSLLAASAIAGCYQSSKKVSKYALLFSVGAWVFSFLAWVVFATLVAGNERCSMGSKGVYYVTSIMGSFFQLFSSVLIALHWGMLARGSHRSGSGGYVPHTSDSMAPPAGINSSAADPGYSSVPDDNPFAASRPPASKPRAGGYGTTVSDSPFD
ncbi:uncharacterized protein AMSG_00928 [Thecamonas trahens ATCC 50062]|uniref:Uncharacterized protein n=1 Tax=Thecamonas trahens ATCC 50062 TaxID=461836 RepID=A0A0L0DIS8_THETB|nr:hypothetical protein AMSG_00928 [Thecamonas trahens ATCC 50062]KNC52100.1 hypothetical protein AMSG_00928 [Thecamonas trahens ATCC 50062]|eukprot:XP_013762105.1 hypothetical protein AMSG_00928 [Thecamonas trahens ATCC 50062]